MQLGIDSEIKDTNNSYLLYVKKINWGSQSLFVVALCEKDWGASQSFLYLQTRMHGHGYGCMDTDTNTSMGMIQQHEQFLKIIT